MLGPQQEIENTYELDSAAPYSRHYIQRHLTVMYDLDFFNFLRC